MKSTKENVFMGSKKDKEERRLRAKELVKEMILMKNKHYERAANTLRHRISQQVSQSHHQKP